MGTLTSGGGGQEGLMAVMALVPFQFFRLPLFYTCCLTFCFPVILSADTNLGRSYFGITDLATELKL
jgi:hypothetical protein